MPMIMAPTLRAAAIHRGAHRPDGVARAREDRLPDQEMADIELDESPARRRSLSAVS